MSDANYDPPQSDSSRSSRSESMVLLAKSDIYRLLIENVRDYAIFALDTTGHIATWNPGAQRFKGYTEDEIVGKHFSIFYPPEDIARGKPAWELEVAAEVGRFEDEGWRLRKDGSRFWANVVITALRDESGTLVGFGKVTRDLTERRESELRAIEDARRVASAEMANQAKSEFLAAMSHELRTPLNAIGGYAELLQLGVHGPVTPDQMHALERIRHSQHHLLGIINDLLNYSRLEAGRVAYDIGPVPLGEILSEAEKMIEPQARAKHVSLTHETPAVDVIALADRAKVEQILVNLLSNAVKFTLEGGAITLRAESRGDRVALEVADTGIGIPADKLESIFEPFVQVGRSLTSPSEGTGLGLAISRGRAPAQGGDQWATTREGAGSGFTLTLPKST